MRHAESGDIVLKSITTAPFFTYGSSFSQTLLTAANPYAGNSLENPCAVAPRTARVSVRDSLDIPAHSFQVLRLTPAR